MNKVIILGRLTADPEIRYTQAGKAVASLTLAVSKPFGADGADFINCVAWEKTGEIIAKHATKGTKILIEARLSARSYEKDGARKTITELVIENFKFFGNKPAEKSESTDPELSKSFNDFSDSDVPF